MKKNGTNLKITNMKAMVIIEDGFVIKLKRRNWMSSVSCQAITRTAKLLLNFPS